MIKLADHRRQEPIAMQLNMRHLEVFRAVADAGSIRAAARTPRLTQPAMTYAIRELEQSVDAQLLVRSARGVVPTEIGQALLRRARVLFNEIQRTHDEIAQLRDGAGGHVRVALSSFAIAHLLPGALLAFRKRCPGVALELRELSGFDAQEPWQQGELDFAVLSEPGAAVDDGLQRETLLEFPTAVIVRAGHPLARAGAQPLVRLQEALWVLPSYGAQVLRQAFGTSELALPRNLIVCHSIQVGLSLVRKADALTLAAASVLQSPGAARGLAAVRLPRGLALPRVRVSLLVRDAQLLTPAARGFMDCLRAEAAALRGSALPG